jgi:hypothetical protein
VARGAQWAAVDAGAAAGVSAQDGLAVVGVGLSVVSGLESASVPQSHSAYG